jgi:cobyrinic acid a,c-diamide synthase
VISEAVRDATGLPVLGVVPRNRELVSLLPDRHLGLVPPQEHDEPLQLGPRLVELAESALDLEGLLSLADGAPAWEGSVAGTEPGEDEPEEAEADSPGTVAAGTRVRVGIFEDRAFSFYYPENLAALRRAGAELVPVAPTRDPELPEVDALVLGGGFPETEAEALSANETLRDAVGRASLAQMPIYAECGGLMYLCRAFRWQGVRHPMAGVFALELEVTSRPRGHGYMEVVVDGQNPLFPLGTRLRGHEFHYSRLLNEKPEIPTVYAIERGTGIGAGRDGLLQGNTLASYLHLHALGVPGWAEALVEAAKGWRGK